MKNKQGWFAVLVLVCAGLMLFNGCGSTSNTVNTSNPTSSIATSTPDASTLNTQVQSPSPTASSTTSGVVITYSGKMIDSAGQAAPASGNRFLVISLSAENHGNSSFSVDPQYFALAAGGKRYISKSVTGLDSLLKHADLLDGMSAGGDIVYEVPADTADYTLEFIGMSFQTIRWVKQ